VTRKTEPHQNRSRSHPESSGPREAIAPPMPDHNAIERVRAGPDHSAVISASVVGYAIPADTPPRMRAITKIVSLGEYAARRQVGTESIAPRISIILRP
jgi:hypothetical protein